MFRLPCSAALLMLLLTSAANAAFNANKLENFSGTTFDLATWEIYPPTYTGFSPAIISQNNGLNLTPFSALPTGYTASYTTINSLVGVGQGVRAHLNIHNFSPTISDLVSLMLTTDSGGPGAQRYLDSRYVDIDYTTLGTTQGFVNASQGGNGSGDGFTVYPNLLQLNHTYTFQIVRDSPTSATMSLFDANTLLGQTSRTGLQNVPANLHIALYAQEADVTFSDVQIIPEPATLPLVATAAFLLGKRRR